MGRVETCTKPACTLGPSDILGSQLRSQQILHAGRKTNRPVPLHARKGRPTLPRLERTSRSRAKAQRPRPQSTSTISSRLSSGDRSTDGWTIARIFWVSEESLLSVNDRDRSGRRIGEKSSIISH